MDPAGLVVLDAVAKEVQQDLFQVQLAAQQVDIAHIGVFFLHMQAGAFRLEAHDLGRFDADLLQVEGLAFQREGIPLQLGHIQHIVDQ